MKFNPIFIVGIFVLLIKNSFGFSELFPVYGQEQGFKKPQGIYLVNQWDKDVESQILELPFVDGIVVRTYWNKLNPSEGIYDWSYLDRQFQKAVKYKKGVHLIIAPGFYSPRWVLENDKIEKANFQVPAGPLQNTNQPLPLPWDETYLSLWFSFLDCVAERYGNHPSLNWISVTGPNSHNGECALPRKSSDEVQWLKLTQNDKTVLETKLIRAWLKTIDYYAKTFNKKYFTLSLVLKSFPVGRDKELETNFTETIANYGINRSPLFGLQTNGLDGRPLEPKNKNPLSHWSLIKKYSTGSFTGFQTRAPVNLYNKTGRSGKKTVRAVQGKKDIFNQLIRNGLSYQVDFIEIYETDLADSGLKDILTQARQMLIR